MGKAKDAFTFYGTIGEHKEEERLDKREWAMNTWKMPPQKTPLPQRGYISLFDLSVMMGNDEYWRVSFTDETANKITLEQATLNVQRGKVVELERRGELFKLLSFDGGYFLTELQP